MDMDSVIKVLQAVYQSQRSLERDARNGDIMVSDVYEWARYDADAIERALVSLGADVPDIDDDLIDEEE